MTIYFNACQGFEATGNFATDSSTSNRGPAGVTPRDENKNYIGTPVTNSIKSRLSSLANNNEMEEDGIFLVDYVNEIKDIFSVYYDEPITFSVIEIDGRSLLNDYESYIFRRKLIAFSLPQSKSVPVALLAFSPLSNEFELIIWDDFSKRYEFLVIDHVYNRGVEFPLVVSYANRNTCVMCHQNEGAIFARAPWGETHFLRNTAQQYLLGNKLALEKDPKLLKFINKGLKLKFNEREVETARVVSINSYKPTITMYDNNIRSTSKVLNIRKIFTDYCSTSDSECKSAVLNYLLGYSNLLPERPSRTVMEKLRSSILADVVPSDNIGVLVPKQTIGEDTNINEVFSNTFTVDPLNFTRLSFTEIAGLNAILPTGQPNPLLPATLRPKTDQITQHDAFNELKKSEDIMKAVFGFNKKELKSAGGSDRDQVKAFIALLSSINHWPLNRQIFKKYLKRFEMGVTDIESELAPTSYYKDEIEELEDEILVSIKNQNHVTIIKTCQSCHTSGSVRPINFYDLKKIKSYVVNEESFGQSIVDSIIKGTMPPQDTDVNVEDFEANKDEIINFLKAL